MPDKVVMIVTRNYKPDLNVFSPGKVVDMSQEFDYLMHNKYSASKTKAAFKEITDFITNDIGAPYASYLPHIGVFLMQMIASHPLCAEVNFIEEGSASYSRRLQSDKGTLRNGIKALISRCLYPSKKFWLTDQLFKDLSGRLNIKNTWGISDRTFEFLTYRKQVVHWEKFGIVPDIDEQYPIYIFDALIEMKFVDPQLYLDVIKQMLQETAREFNYIKFHPYQTAENRILIKALFDERYAKYIELGQDVITENLMLGKTGLTFIGFSSSVLLYANICGHNVKTYEGYLKQDKQYTRYRQLYDFKL